MGLGRIYFGSLCVGEQCPEIDLGLEGGKTGSAVRGLSTVTSSYSRAPHEIGPTPGCLLGRGRCRLSDPAALQGFPELGRQPQACWPRVTMHISWRGLSCPVAKEMWSGADPSCQPGTGQGC